MAHTVMAHVRRVVYSHGPYSYGTCSSSGLYSYGLYSYGTCLSSGPPLRPHGMAWGRQRRRGDAKGPSPMAVRHGMEQPRVCGRRPLYGRTSFERRGVQARVQVRRWRGAIY